MDPWQIIWIGESTKFYWLYRSAQTKVTVINIGEFWEVSSQTISQTQMLGDGDMHKKIKLAINCVPIIVILK